MENNVRILVGKGLNVEYFFVAAYTGKRMDVIITKHCRSAMVADFFTKPLQEGQKKKISTN